MSDLAFQMLNPYAPEAPMLEAVRAFTERLSLRRSVRSFSTRPVPREVVEQAILAAGSAPSGAHKQPWRFVCVSDPLLKSQIREAAEEEERRFYNERASERWLEDIKPFGTTSDKPFLEEAPWLIVVFALTKSEEGGQNYYVNESVGIAVGMLLSALHEGGLATLTHTPSPMRFLRDVLGRPSIERPYVLIPVGFPAVGCQVPDLERKTLQEISVFHEGE